MKRRSEKRVGAGWEKSPSFAKITKEMNQLYWQANNRYMFLSKIDGKGYICLENQAFTTLNLQQ